MAVQSFSSVQIFVFIALSYSRASSHKACEATCEILFLYCGVKHPSWHGWILTHWLNALAPCTAEKTVCETSPPFERVSPGLRDWVGLCRISDNGCPERDTKSNKSRHTDFEPEMRLVRVNNAGVWLSAKLLLYSHWVPTNQVTEW